MSLRELYNEHAAGTAADLCAAIRNGLREHIDRVAEVCKTVHALHPASILDAPCGMGMLTSLMSLYVDGPTRVVGLDVSDGHVAMARELWGVDAVQGDLCEWRPEERFELVCCMELLEHVPDPAMVVASALALSTKWVLFTVPIEAQPVDGVYHVRKIHPTAIWEWVEQVGGRIERMWTLPSAFGEKPKWQGWIFALAQVAE